MYKTTVFAGLLVAVLSFSALGSGFLGTPTAELEQGQWSGGFSYTYVDMELDTTTRKLSESLYQFVTNFAGDEVLFERLDTFSSTFKMAFDDVKIQRYYGTIGYGISDSWEAYVQLGIADLKANRDPGSIGRNFDNDFAWGWGTRYTFHERGNWRLGASVQMNWLDTTWDKKLTTDLSDEVTTEVRQEKITISWETYDVLVAVGPTVDMGNWKLYGGPFYYYITGDFGLKATQVRTTISESSDLAATQSRNDKGSADLEADSIGGFVGAQFSVMDNANVTTEFSFTDDGWAAGAGVAVLF